MRYEASDRDSAQASQLIPLRATGTRRGDGMAVFMAIEGFHPGQAPLIIGGSAIGTTGTRRARIRVELGGP